MLLISENLGIMIPSGKLTNAHKFDPNRISPGQKGLFNEKWGAHTKLNLKALLFV
jgi:hypothetical protein